MPLRRPMPFRDLPYHPKAARVPVRVTPGGSSQTIANQAALVSGPPNLGFGLYARRRPPSLFRRRRRRKSVAAKPRKRRASRKRRRTKKRAHLVKGSAAAKRFMARLRAKRRR